MGPVHKSAVLSTSEDNRLLGHAVENQFDILEYVLICVVASAR